MSNLKGAIPSNRMCFTKSLTSKNLGGKPKPKAVLPDKPPKFNEGQKLLKERVPQICHRSTASNTSLFNMNPGQPSPTVQKIKKFPVKIASSDKKKIRRPIQEASSTSLKAIPGIHIGERLFTTTGRNKGGLNANQQDPGKGNKKAKNKIKLNDSAEANFEEIKEGVLSSEIRTSCARQMHPQSSNHLMILRVNSDSSLDFADLIQKKIQQKIENNPFQLTPTKSTSNKRITGSYASTTSSTFKQEILEYVG